MPRRSRPYLNRDVPGYERLWFKGYLLYRVVRGGS